MSVSATRSPTNPPILQAAHPFVHTSAASLFPSVCQSVSLSARPPAHQVVHASVRLLPARPTVRPPASPPVSLSARPPVQSTKQFFHPYVRHQPARLPHASQSARPPYPCRLHLADMCQHTNQLQIYGGFVLPQMDTFRGASVRGFGLGDSFQGDFVINL